MRFTLDTKDFTKKMNNVVDYSLGFVEGVQRGKTIFLKNIGAATIQVLKEYIDTNARMNPKALHHVYEWNLVGSPGARLFDIDYTISNLGLSIRSTFKQSKTSSSGSSDVFYNKAKIMENGIPVTIKPKKNVLVFESGGETIFTKKDIVNYNPGGREVAGSYEKIFDEFFLYYFKQSFLRASGILNYLNNPVAYKKNIAAGAKSGKSVGVKAGYTWIANTTIGVDK